MPPRRLSLFLALLAVLSVGAKVLAGDQSLRGAEQSIQGAEKQRVAEFLGRQGFEVGEQGGLFMPAVAGECRLLAVLAAAEGWHRDITRRLASHGDRVFFVFGGETYPDQPGWRPWLHHYWRVLNFYVSRKVPSQPMLGIVASPACDLRDMPWQDVAEVS